VTEAVKIISPEIIRDFYKNPSRKSQTLEKIVALLQYCTMDLLKEPYNFEPLAGVHLLLSASQSTTSFSSSDRKILLNNETQLFLLPCKDLFVDFNLSTTLPFLFGNQQFRKQFDMQPLNATLLLKNLHRALEKQGSLEKWNGENPTSEWVSDFWKFMKAQKFSVVSAGSGDASKWPIIPTLSGGLFSLERIDMIIKPSQSQIQLQELFSKLGCHFLDAKLCHVVETQTFPKMDGIATLSNPLSVCNAMKDIPLNFNSLTSKDKQLLLEYFNTATFQLEGSHSAFAQVLRNCPIFEAIDGTFVALDGDWQILPFPHEDMPSKGLLKFKPDFHNFYEALGATKLLPSTFFQHHLFPTFPGLSQNSRDKEMDFVRTTWALRKAEDPSFVWLVAGLAWIEHSGKLLKASELYNPQDDILRQLYPNNILPDSYIPWVDFLKEIGLVMEVRTFICH
jgi:hypothetical protein